MIFKGNTKLTPALTELLDDTTPSSNKTYSSNKIETLIGGGGGGCFLHKKFTNTQWRNKISSISNLSHIVINGNASGVSFIIININEFTTVNEISDLTNYDLYVKINNINANGNWGIFRNANAGIDNTTETTKPLVDYQYLSLNNYPIAEITVTKNISSPYGASVIDKSDGLYPLKVLSSPYATDVQFMWHSSQISAYYKRIVSENISFDTFVNLDNDFFKNCEILIYAIPKI